VPIPQGRELLWDIHAGVCGHHTAPRTLVGNAFRQGFYWPTAVADASEIVRTYEGCQFYARKSNLPAHVLRTIPVTWPFAVWGLHIVGPLRKAPGSTPTFWSLSTSSPSGWRCVVSQISGRSRRSRSSPTSSTAVGV
jgi:hypothetical protein